MKILFPERIEEFSRKHADAKEALERWSGKLADASGSLMQTCKPIFRRLTLWATTVMYLTSRATTIGQSCW